MSNNTVVQKSSIGIFGWMFLIFLTLKLVGIISWSWWWVTAPLWGPLVLFAVIFTICVAIVYVRENKK